MKSVSLVFGVLFLSTEIPVSALDSVVNWLDSANTPMSECWLADGVAVAIVSLNSACTIHAVS